MSRRTVALVVTLVVLLGALVAAVFAWRSGNDAEPFSASGMSTEDDAARDTAVMAPAGERIRVRILNGTKVAGLARRGTQHLRDFGYDVVDYGNAGSDAELSTFVQVSAESERVGARIARALGVTDVRRADAPLAFVDVVVVLGADWQPPAQPFRP